MDLAQIYRDAAAAVTSLGFVKMTRHTWSPTHGHGAVCMLGALEVALEGLLPASQNYRNIAETHPAVCDLAKRLPTLKPPAFCGSVSHGGSWKIADWNNAPERTAKDVIKAFLDAALAIESTQGTVN